MTKNKFAHVRTWVFDLDQTLYPVDAALFDQIEVKMTDWVARHLNVDPQTADKLRSDYWKKYGTTLSGLMAEHSIDPLPYLQYVHDIDFSVLEIDFELRKAIENLPGRKIVYTNGSEPYAQDVLKARGLDDLFDAVYGIEHADFHPKPTAQAYEKIIALDKFDPQKAAMFEDDPRNLYVPHSLGMRTIHIAPENLHEDADHIEYKTDHITSFLQSVI